jgi:hypothetical protein
VNDVASRADRRGVAPARERDGNGSKRGKAGLAYLLQLAERATLGTAAVALGIVLALVSRDSLDTPLQWAFAFAFAAIPLSVTGFLCRELVLDSGGFSRLFELSRGGILVAIMVALLLVAAALVALLSHALSLHMSWFVVYGLLWIVVPPCYAIGISAKYLEAQSTASGTEADLTSRSGETPPTSDTRPAAAPIGPKRRHNSQR